MSNIEKNNRKGNWEPFAARAPWSVVNSRELQIIYGVSLNTINSWKMRGILPEPVKHRRLPSGNRNHFRICSVRSRMEQRPETEIYWEWAERWLADYIDTIQTLGQVEFLITSAYNHFGVERPLIPPDFTGLDVKRPSLTQK